MKKVNISKFFSKNLNKTWKRITFMFLCVIILNLLISVTTGTNLIENGMKKLLNSIGVYTEEVRFQNILSNSKNESPGDWLLSKYATWTSPNTATLELNINSNSKTTDKYKDIIILLNINFSDNNIDYIKSSTQNFISNILQDENNRVAVIIYDREAIILSDFTNDSDAINKKIEKLNKGKTTLNIYNALKEIEPLIENYKEKEERELTTILLTNNTPYLSLSSTQSEYEFLKAKYSFMSINAIQFDLGSEIREEITTISDKQVAISLEDDDLYSTLIDASNSNEFYENFKISEFINNDYFYVNDESDLKTTIGTASIDSEDNSKIIWDLKNNLLTGTTDNTLKITLTLKDEYVDFENHHAKSGYYPISKETTIESKLLNQDLQTKTNNNEIVLNPEYTLSYLTNTPDGCNIEAKLDRKYFAFETVAISDFIPVCSGYQFKGWKVDDSATEINDDNFIMPAEDSYVGATWSKLSLSKSMIGSVNEATTLWKQVRNVARTETNGAKTYGLINEDGYPIYFYTTPYYDNVLFAGFCWKIIRTTETGGTKLIYNGPPSAEGTCDNRGEAATIGTSLYGDNNSIADVGYMVNKSTLSPNKDFEYDRAERINIIERRYVGSFTNYYYGPSIKFENGDYILENAEQKYYLDNYENLGGYYTCFNDTNDNCGGNVYYIIDSDRDNIYTLELSNGKSLEDANKTIRIGQELSENSNGTYTLENVVEISIIDYFETYKNDSSNNWEFVEQKVYNKFICQDYTQTNCNTVIILDAFDYNKIGGHTTDFKYLFSDTFTYDGENYHLTNASPIWRNFESIGEKKYSCLNENGICKKLYYVYSILTGEKGDTNEPYVSVSSIELSNGTDIYDSLDLMFGPQEENDKFNVTAKDSPNYLNKDDSAIKKYIDSWYEENLLAYGKYLEDTVWCNNRKYYFESNRFLEFDYALYSAGESIYDAKGLLVCPSKIDSFTVSPENGNGDLKYPIGLLTFDEYALSINFEEWYSELLKISEEGEIPPVEYYMMSPNIIYEMTISVRAIYVGRGGDSDVHYEDRYVRPSISLKNSVEYLSGDGTINNPYIIKTE